jgi:hypothetical protein
MAESDWVAPERHVEIVDMILAVGFLICLASYPPAAPEAKLNFHHRGVPRFTTWSKFSVNGIVIDPGPVLGEPIP